MQSLTEAAKELLDKNVKSKKSGNDPMPKSKASVTDVGNSLSGNVPDALKGVPSATPPGKVGNGNKDAFGAGSPKPTDKNSYPADTSFTQDSMPSVDSIINGSPAKLGKQTFDSNEGSISPAGHTDISYLFKGESVSPEFIDAASTLFEAAVTDRVNAIVAEIEDELNEQYEQAVEEMYAELSEQTDAYLNHFVNEWVEQHSPVLESNIRSEIAESFMVKVKELFEDHNIDINEENVDIVEGLSEQVEELQAKLDEAYSVNEQLLEQFQEINRSDIVAEACEGLTATQAEQLAMLSESVSYNSIDDFADKVNVIKESYILNGASDVIRASSEQMLTEDATPVEEVIEESFISPEMRSAVAYLDATTK